MAEYIPDLHATHRTGAGKGAARQARRAGLVPGIAYGGDKEPLPITLPLGYLLKKLQAGRFLSTLFNLKVEGFEDVRVICRDVQRDVVKDLPIHLDLLRLRRTSRINLFIPVQFTNEEACPGLKQGGVLTIVRTDVELNVIAGNIPGQLVVDLAGRAVGDTMTISDIALPADTTPTIDRDFVIASISAPSALRSSDLEEGAGAAPADSDIANNA
ncbi:MAG: 50S ribosomal protein L25/general stress protein Ctc [Rhodobacteraceae bacterium]|nr:50S ribosomal protein L25/general stress protein Ctc [Paracoccaceae bacterium]